MTRPLTRLTLGDRKQTTSLLSSSPTTGSSTLTMTQSRGMFHFYYNESLQIILSLLLYFMQNCRILPQVHSVSAREFIQQSWYSFDNPSLVALTWETREQCTEDSNYTETDTNQRGGLQISKHYTHHHHHQAGLILVHCDQARRKRVPIHINFSHPRPTQVISPQYQWLLQYDSDNVYLQ